jgi:hypothetical protein
MTALTASTVEPVTPEYAESLGFVPGFTEGMYFIRSHNHDRYYLVFRDDDLVSMHLYVPGKPVLQFPSLPTRYNLARIVEEFTHK